jgi:hypothetical protein
MMPDMPMLDLPIELRQAIYHASETLDFLTRYLDRHPTDELRSKELLRTAGKLSVGLIGLPRFAKPVLPPPTSSPAVGTSAPSSPGGDQAAAPPSNLQEVTHSADSESSHSPDQDTAGPRDDGPLPGGAGANEGHHGAAGQPDSGDPDQDGR